jgi:hypothetical protein
MRFRTSPNAAHCACHTGRKRGIGDAASANTACRHRPETRLDCEAMTMAVRHARRLRRCPSRLSSGLLVETAGTLLPRLRIAEKGEHGRDGDFPVAHGRPTFHHPRMRPRGLHHQTILRYPVVAGDVEAVLRIAASSSVRLPFA